MAGTHTEEVSGADGTEGKKGETMTITIRSKVRFPEPGRDKKMIQKQIAEAIEMKRKKR